MDRAASVASGLSFDTIAIIGTVVGTGIALFLGLGAMVWRMSSRIDRRIAEDRREFVEAQADFRREMQRLAERRSHVEGRLRPAE